MSTGYIMLDSPNPTTPQGTFPRRGGYAPSGTCIVHTSEGAWTAGVDSLTGLVQRRADYGCYHRACDWIDIARYYPWWWECWQDSETNNWAVGIAAACRTTDWKIMPAEIREGYYRNMARMAADFVLYMKEVHGITVPLRRITGAEARNRVPGFCAHGDSGIARSDPGADFDWPLFFKYTAEALNNPEDTLSAAEVKTITDSVNHAFHRLETELPGKIAEAVRNALKTTYMDPETGQPTEQETSVNTMASFRDFQDTATRKLIKDTAEALLSAINKANSVPADAAQKAYDEFLAKLKDLKIVVAANPAPEDPEA